MTDQHKEAHVCSALVKQYFVEPPLTPITAADVLVCLYLLYRPRLNYFYQKYNF